MAQKRGSFQGLRGVSYVREPMMERKLNTKLERAQE